MVPDLKSFVHKEYKIAAANFFFYIFFFFQFVPSVLTSFCPHFPKSKLFILLEFLGKSNGKKWSEIWKLLLIKGVKLLRKKKFFFDKFWLTSRIFLVLVLLSASVKKFFVSRMFFFLVREHMLHTRLVIKWAGPGNPTCYCSQTHR